MVAIMKRIDKLRAAEHAVRAAIEDPQVLNTDEAETLREIILVANRLLWSSTGR